MTDNPAHTEITTLGKYQIIRELGRGAMGVVYEGYDPLLDRQVALKTIRKDLLLGSQSDAGNMMQRFRREAQAAGRLHHPNVVVVYDYAEEKDSVYIAMELVRGKELKAFFQQKHRFDLKSALRIMSQLLDGLAYSHRHNIVHRDIKPGNIILVDDDRQVKITDFGIARIDSSELTQVGEVMGTPTHIAPEQLLGKTVDGRADLFSAGVIFYQLLTGARPFVGSNVTAVMHSILTHNPTPPSKLNSQLPALCDIIIKKALAKDAANRYQTADEFRIALKNIREKPPAQTTTLPTVKDTHTALEIYTPSIQKANYPNTLAEWVEYLTNQDMPIFSHTARRINEAMHSSNFGAIALGRIIQQDPTLTAKLLKLGNSSYYNPSRQKLPNINRAIIILGVNNIHNLAIACSYVESATAGHNNLEVDQQVAHSIHAAVQAKAFASQADDPYPEEVFVAALMSNFGQVAFWCHGNEACAQIRQLIKAGLPAQNAEIKVLSFTLKELDVALSKAWKLGGLIEECIGEITPTSSYRAKLIHYCHDLVNSLEKGLNSPEVETSLAQIAHITQQSPESLKPLVIDNAEQAVLVASQLGARGITHHIFKPVLPSIESSPSDAPVVTQNTASIDQQERIRFLQEISNMLSGKIDISALFEKVLDSIEKAIYMDRVLFALITPDRAKIREKSSRGMGGKSRKEILIFDIVAEKNLFSYALEEKSGCWINPYTDADKRQLFTADVTAQLGEYNECFLMPVAINRRIIGLFFADRATSKSPLDLQTLNVFIELVQQANIGINLSQKQK